MAPFEHRRKVRRQAEHFPSQPRPDHPLDASIPFHDNESAVDFSELNDNDEKGGFSARTGAVGSWAQAKLSWKDPSPPIDWPL
jgi:hypothetical protein